MEHVYINHCTAENAPEIRRQRTRSNQQQANGLEWRLQKKKVCPLPQNWPSDGTFLLVMAYRHLCHFEKQTPPPTPPPRSF